MDNDLDSIISQLKIQFPLLGIEFNLENYQKIDNLYELPSYLIQYAKLIGYGDAEKFLEFFVTPQNHPHLTNLYWMVIKGNTPLQEWGRFPYIIPDMVYSDIYTKTFKDLYWFMHEEFMMIFKPLYSDWVNFSVKVGCPIMVDKIGDYRSIRIKGTSDYSFKYPVIPIKNNPQSRTVAFRRWIAQRAASYLFRVKKLESFKSFDDLSDNAPISAWTEDAEKAITGLLREKNVIGWKEGEIPGFVGPDEFYL